MAHTPECERARAAWEAGQLEYLRKWPFSCPSCLGWGGRSWHDAGVGATFFDPCRACLDWETCPRCSAVEAFRQGPGGPCRLCGWAEGDQGCPVEPECFCGLDFEELLPPGA